MNRSDVFFSFFFPTVSLHISAFLAKSLDIEPNTR